MTHITISMSSKKVFQKSLLRVVNYPQKGISQCATQRVRCISVALVSIYMVGYFVHYCIYMWQNKPHLLLSSEQCNRLFISNFFNRHHFRSGPYTETSSSAADTTASIQQTLTPFKRQCT